MPPLVSGVLDLEEGEGDAEDHRPDHQRRPAAWAPSWPNLPLTTPSTASTSEPFQPAAVAAVGEDADGEHAEGAADAVDRDGAHRVVELEPALHEQHRLDHQDAGDDADDGRPAPGLVKAQGAVMATRPASMPLAIMPGSGLSPRT